MGDATLKRPGKEQIVLCVDEEEPQGYVMAEIKREIKALAFGEQHTAGHTDYVITEDHTIADLARLIIAQGWDEDLQYCLEQEAK